MVVAVAIGRRLAMARACGAPVLVRYRVPLAPSLLSFSRRAFCHSSISWRGIHKLVARTGAHDWKSHRERTFSRAAAVEDSPEVSKKRLSREERAALVESYVRNYMAEKDGEFPSVAAVLKDTGGSRAVVKEILTELQTKVSSEVKEESSSSSNAPSEIAETTTELKSKVDELVESSPEAVSSSGVSEDEASTEEEPEEADDVEQQQQSAEAKPAEKITSLRRMTGETPGEINTYGDILNRLRSLGTDPSRKKEPAVAGPSEVEEAAPESLKRASFAARILPPRHGMFVRFLHPSATEEDLKNAFGDCGEITRVSAVKPMKPTAKFTYGFIDFKTADGLSNALRKNNVVIRGHKVETEAAPTQNSAASVPDVVMPNAREARPGGSALIDNLVSKVVSMVPETNTNSVKGLNGQETRFSRAGNSMQSKGEDFKGTAQDTRFRPGVQRNEGQPRQQFSPRGEPQFQPRNNDVPPHFGMRNENGAMLQLSDPQKMRKNLAVCVDNIPANANLNQVKEALSVYGEISGTYLKHRDMSGSSLFFEYMNEEAKDNALVAHWLYISGQQLRISRADTPKTTVVRVSNISPSTPDNDFVNACKSCGQVERVESRRDRVRDVFFHGSEMRNMNRILDRMNEITLSGSRWNAKPAPRFTHSVFSSPDGQEWLCQQMKNLLKNQESMLQQMQIEHRDLRELTMHAVEMLASPQSRRP